MVWWFGSVLYWISDIALAPIFGVYSIVALRVGSMQLIRIHTRLSIVCVVAFLAGNIAAHSVEYAQFRQSLPDLFEPLARASTMTGIALTALLALTRGLRRLAIATAVATVAAWLVSLSTMRFLGIIWSDAIGLGVAGQLFVRLLPPLTWHAVCGLALLRIARERSMARRSARVVCSSCGYALTGLGNIERCPECGAVFGAPGATARK